ncbi:MAG: PDZ domain-containing protein, partial [Anaerolineaceae bacterium]|nr:PDZ domain-containing protein [Anaerolineaceae bacterium]
MSKTARYVLGSCLILILILGAFSSGILVGWFLPHPQAVSVLAAPTPVIEEKELPGETIQETPTAVEQNTPGVEAQATPTSAIELPPATAPQNTEELFAPFWEVWDLAQKEYVDQPVDQEQMMRGAIRGMLESLGDQHTSYMDPEQYRQANIEMQGDYEGIGAWVDTTGEYLVITSPMPGSPAEKAGLKTGDTIIAVDKEDMTNVDGSLVLRKVLGPAGTPVTLTVRREGEEKPFDVTITRAKITIPSVESKMADNN